MILDVVYIFVCGFVWVGIVVCLLVLVVVGLLVFVGVGGFVLLVFGLINFYFIVYKKEVYFVD